ncbi:unnamed protein product [Phaedon cochleariae]|uniref:SPRY domain-containing SOCS box protein 3 n=1 Tax=Phaedon cochleariae TaxID=80249 RepID=A0A9N9SJ85_PHACE|nr:unnamed protein product [Phaedon cochleariae]
MYRTWGTSAKDTAIGLFPLEQPARAAEEDPPADTPPQPPDANPLRHGCDDAWAWDGRSKSPDARLGGPGSRVAHFHPNWSSGTAGVRGDRVLNNGRFFWELHLSRRIFGTSMMFGIGTKKARLHADSFTNLLGKDNHGWGLSHKGLLWHGGKWTHYTKPFRENVPTTIGLLFDGIAGTVSYYKDESGVKAIGQDEIHTVYSTKTILYCEQTYGDMFRSFDDDEALKLRNMSPCLGIAFRGLNEVKEPLYPIVCSTAAKTEMVLDSMKRDFVNLQDRCRAVIVKRIQSRKDLEKLFLPPKIRQYLDEAVLDSVVPFKPVNQNNMWVVI